MFSNKLLVSLFCIAFLLFSTNTFSQINSDGEETEDLNYEEGGYKEDWRKYKNVLKVNIPVLAYERILEKDRSVNLHLFYFRLNTLETSRALDLPDLSPKNQSFVSAFILTGEYRMYSKDAVAPDGFYFAPFIRYSSIKYNYINDFYQDGTGANFPGAVAGKLSGIGLGGQVGIQYTIEDRFTIDWGIIGLGVNFANLKVRIRSDESNVDYEGFAAEENEDILDDTSFVRNNLFYKADGDSILSKKRKILPILRSLITFGVRF